MPRTSLLCSLSLAATAAALASPLPQLRGVQGVDDQSAVDALRAAGDVAGLDLRYATLSRELQSGLRRYNAFWSAFEGRVPPSAAPIACPAGSELTPRNESERVRLGFAHFHCYDSATLAGFDDTLARDAAAGAVSTFIVYGSPDFAIDPACTGFPWPPNPNYRSGCIPWKNMDDWQDYILMLTLRWNAPWGSGRARLSGLCVWNEVQSQGWSDPSPVLPNRYTGAPYTPAQMATYAGAIADLMLGAGRGAALGTPAGQDPPMLWLSTDHFNTAPPLSVGDVMHVGLWELLDALWPIINTTYAWGVCVHPYDAGDPRQNLTAQGIYTFATLRESVAEFQCRKLAEVAHVPPEDCWAWPQTAMWASEQGWPTGKTMNKTLQARNICYAHGLSVAQGVWAVSHNLFQSVQPSNQGGGGDFSLIDEPPVVFLNLSNADGHETYDAYRATAPGVFGVTSDHYCCTRWASGCQSADAAAPAAAGDSAFFLSPSGSDANDGLSPATPWLTLPRAQAAVVALKAANGGALPGDVRVSLAAGTYELGAAFTIAQADGGDAAHSVTYAGPAPGGVAAGGAAVLSAGAAITGWAATATPGVFSAPVPARKGATFLRQLFGAADGLRRPLARSRVMTAVAVGQWGVVFNPADLAPAAAPSLVEAEVIIWHNWVNSQNKLAAVDWEAHNISVKGTAGDPFFSAGGLRWALQNVADPVALAAGSFYVAGGTVFYRALPGEDPTNPAVTPLVGELLPEAVQFAGTAAAPVVNVALANLTIAHSAAALEETCGGEGCGGQSCSESTTAAVHAFYSQGVSLDGVELLGAGAYAVWFDEGSVQCSITRSWLHSLGMGGVRVGNGQDTGSPSSAPARQVLIADNVIEDAGHVVPAGTGVLAQECANTTITHNHIHHLYYTAVSTGWTWGYMPTSDVGNTVSFNLLHDIFQGELSDGGCVYNLGRSPGTVIDNNICHTSNAYAYGGWGLYTDEGSSNVTISNNVVFATKDASFHQHYGTDNVIVNNVFAFGSSLPCSGEATNGDCDVSAIRSSQHAVAQRDAGVNSSFTFRRNIVLLGAEEPAAAPWAANLTHLFHTNGPTLGVANMTFEGNLYWHNMLADPASELVFGASGDPRGFASWQALGKDAGSLVADPRFVDAEGLDFSLRPDSPALAMGFVPIDVSTVGVRGGAYRAM